MRDGPDQDRIPDEPADRWVIPDGGHGGPANGDGRLPLLATKLAPAPLPGPVVVRDRLLRKLDAGAAGPVTLVSAPAGWGKTTLLGSWFRRGGRGAPLAWLSLEAGDGGDRLWSYLHAALASAGDPVSDPVTRSGPALPVPTDRVDDGFLIHLADALARRSRPVTLILDDLHRIDDPALLDGLDFLLRHTDDRLRLVIGTRTDPALALHRWRLSGELTEVRIAELSFTAVETAELLVEHAVALPADRAVQLHARTEGWPAGLRLAALSLRGHPDPTRFVDDFGGDHPDVAAYLTEEVLANLTDDAREALMRSSIAGRVCGGLINAVTGRTDGERLLDEAERAGGFVVPLGTRPVSYRCHRMLRELLRAELGRRPPEQISDLNVRAATWHAEHGLPAPALHHALAAGQWRQAVGVLTEYWPQLMADHYAGAVDGPGERAVGDSSLASAAPPAEAVRTAPELALACAAHRLSWPDPRAAEDFLRLADRYEHLLDGSRRRRFGLIAAALRLAQARRRPAAPYLLTAARRLLALAAPGESIPGESIPGESISDESISDESGSGTRRSGAPPGDPGGRALARTVLGTAALTDGDLSTAETELTAAKADAERVSLLRLASACAGRLALVHALRGQLRLAERGARAALTVSSGDRHRRPTDGAHAYLALAIVAAHRDRPEDAEANLALFGDGWPGEPAIAGLAELVRALLRQDRGDLAGSHRALAAGRRLVSRATSQRLAYDFAAAEAGLSLARGEAGRACTLLLPLTDGAARPDAPLAVALARGYLRGGDPRAAVRTLPAWDRPANGSLPLPVRLEAGLIDALSAHRLGDRQRAARLLERVLDLAEPEGFRRIFTRSEPPTHDLLAMHLDAGTAHWPLVNELITARIDSTAQAVTGPPVAVEPLTDRELTVLRYLQSILSNVEIAAELSLSVNTVKTHVRNIYRKLNTTRRRDAVRRARELHLL